MPKSFAHQIILEIATSISKDVKFQEPHAIQHNVHGYFCERCAVVSAQTRDVPEASINKDYYPPADTPIYCALCNTPLYHCLSTRGIRPLLDKLAQHGTSMDPVDAAVLMLALYGSERLNLETDFQRTLNCLQRAPDE